MEASGKNLIIVTGPESTGKTLIAQALSNKYRADFYPEYAREYIQRLNRKYNYTDIQNIAEYQFKQYNKYQSNNKLGIFDTYLIITKVWFLWHSGSYPEWIDDALLSTKGALYLLCAPDIDWMPDSVRENGGEARNILFNTYKEELTKYGLKFRIVTGKDDIRIKNAESFTETYLKRK